MLVALLVLGQLNLNESPVQVRDEGAVQSARRAYAINCVGTSVACTQDGGVMRLEVSGGAAAPVDGEFVTYSANATLSAERVLTSGTNTTVDLGTAGQAKVNLSGTVPQSLGGTGAGALTCTSGQALTSNGTAQSCTSTLTASAFSGTLPVANGGTNLTTADEDATLVGNGTTWQAKTLPSCSNATTSKLLYDNSTNTWSCGTDQTGGGGGTSPLILTFGGF